MDIPPDMAWKKIPYTFIICTEHNAIPLDVQEGFVKSTMA